MKRNTSAVVNACRLRSCQRLQVQQEKPAEGGTPIFTERIGKGYWSETAVVYKQKDSSTCQPHVSVKKKRSWSCHYEILFKQTFAKEKSGRPKTVSWKKIVFISRIGRREKVKAKKRVAQRSLAILRAELEVIPMCRKDEMTARNQLTQWDVQWPQTRNWFCRAAL